MNEIEYYDMEEVYIGTYLPINKVMAVGKNKEIVENYLSNHRSLNKDEYVIELKEVSQSDLLIKYDDMIISEYNGYYIPNIDQMIIEAYSHQTDDLIQNCINDLKYVTLLSSHVKKVPREDVGILLASLKVLVKMRNPKVLSKLEKEDRKTNSILFCPINEYFNKVRSFTDQREMDQRYKYMVMD